MNTVTIVNNQAEISVKVCNAAKNRNLPECFYTLFEGVEDARGCADHWEWLATAPIAEIMEMEAEYSAVPEQF